MAKVLGSGSDGLLRAIKRAFENPERFTHVDIIHKDWCESLDTEQALDCDCEPEYKELQVN